MAKVDFLKVYEWPCVECSEVTARNHRENPVADEWADALQIAVFINFQSKMKTKQK